MRSTSSMHMGSKNFEKECAHLGSLIDTGVDDRIVADNMLEERLEGLERLLGIERDEAESSPSSHHSAPMQGLDGFISLMQEVERLKHRLEAQARELKALKSRVNVQPSGQSTQSYEVNQEVDRARGSIKKRKVMDSNDHQGKTSNKESPRKVTSPGVWTHKYKLYIEQQDDVAPIGSGTLVDAWVEQCNSWFSMDPGWQQYQPFKTCLNSMLVMRYAGLLESPEETLSFACPDCERSQRFCVVFDSERRLLELLPRRNAPRSRDQLTTNLTTFINPMQHTMQ